MAEGEASQQTAPGPWRRIAPENAGDFVICGICESMIFDRQTSKDRHIAWHEALGLGTARQS